MICLEKNRDSQKCRVATSSRTKYGLDCCRIGIILDKVLGTMVHEVKYIWTEEKITYCASVMLLILRFRDAAHTVLPWCCLYCAHLFHNLHSWKKMSICIKDFSYGSWFGYLAVLRQSYASLASFAQDRHKSSTRAATLQRQREITVRLPKRLARQSAPHSLYTPNQHPDIVYVISFARRGWNARMWWRKGQKSGNMVTLVAPCSKTSLTKAAEAMRAIRAFCHVCDTTPVNLVYL